MTNRINSFRVTRMNQQPSLPLDINRLVVMAGLYYHSRPWEPRRAWASSRLTNVAPIDMGRVV